MAIDPLLTWKSKLALLPKVATTAWAANFAEWYADRIVNITTDPTKLVPTGFLFTFDETTFADQLLALTPKSNALAGIQGFADAWETAISTTLYPTTLALLPLTTLGTPPAATPATTFSVITSVLIVSASITAAKDKILELADSPTVADVNDSEFPQKFRDATLLLKINVTGKNSVSPTPGPLSVSNVPLI